MGVRVGVMVWGCGGVGGLRCESWGGGGGVSVKLWSQNCCGVGVWIMV